MSAAIALGPIAAHAEDVRAIGVNAVWHDQLYYPGSSFTVPVYKSLDRENVMYLRPYYPDYYNVWVPIHLNEPSKVYFETCARDNDNQAPWLVHDVPENGGSTDVYYATFANNRITFPRNSVGYGQSGSWVWNSEPMYIDFPQGLPGFTIQGNTGVFLGIKTFNQEVNSKPIGILNSESKNEFISFVDNAEMKIGTLLYYGIDDAINEMCNYSFPSDLGSAVLVTFTDGLDQGSLAMNSTYATAESYAEAISAKIASTRINDVPLQAYSIGLMGQDVMDEERFMQNLSDLSSDPETKALTVDNMESLERELAAIADELVKTSSMSQISIMIPMPSDGDKVRFTLDGASESIESSSVYVEGVYNRSGNYLENVECVGFTSASGETVSATANGIFLNFTFEDCRTPEGELLTISPDEIDQWTFIPSKSAWQHNMEIDRGQQVKVEEIRRSTAIMFVLDCSSSLGDKFSQLKRSCDSFIERLYAATENSAIESVETTAKPSGEVQYYDLTGKRVARPSRGIYIVKEGTSVTKRYFR